MSHLLSASLVFLDVYQQVKERRSQADGERLMAGLLPPQGPSGGVQGRLDGRAVSQAEA